MKLKRPRIQSKRIPVFEKNPNNKGMQAHTRIYMRYFGIGIDDRPLCEYCRRRVIVDIHHLEGRRVHEANNIENLIGLCRSCHTDAHNEKISKCDLQKIHHQNLRAN